MRTVFGIPRISINIQRKELIMNIKKLGFKTTAVLFLVSATFLLGSSLIYAADMCQIIRIQEGKGAGGTRLEIFPDKITVDVGTCTVWINWVTDRDVHVSFRENAKQCVLATDVSAGFQEVELKPGESCYYSDKLSRGKTASITWGEPGTFKYQLEAPGSSSGEGYAGNILATGVITVKGEPAPKKAEVVKTEAPVDMDSDGDGVPDSMDKCPDTPKGATVNKEGCWALKGVVLFDFDNSTIKPEAYPLLDEVAVILEKNPDMKGEISGHTCSTGPEEYNQMLSEKRAGAVEAYLENKGIDASRFTSKGYGASKPIASNDTLEGRKQNRRVELKRMK
jgi:outer membrane protein OmpA-like peptidoglycan-associated protein